MANESARILYEKYQEQVKEDRRIFFWQYCQWLLTLPIPMSYELWCYLHQIVDEDGGGFVMTDNPFLCYNCIYLTNYTGNIIECSRLPRRYNPETKCNYFKKQWAGGEND